MSTRITLIVRSARQPGLDWRQAQSGVIFTESMEVLRFLLRKGTASIDLDVERCIIDRAANEREFLEILSQLPEDFAGDLLQIGEDDAGWLSATVRGGGRMLYRLACGDLRFYLETHDIVSGRLALERKIA